MELNLKYSLELQEAAKKRIPGMTQLLSKRPDMFSLGVWPGYYSRAEGAQVWDLDGNRYIDMSLSGIGANILGYADPDVNDAVKRAIDAGSSSTLNCPEEVELAEVLCDLHPWSEMVRYARTGGEAMAMAVRIARAATGRDIVAFCGYHGWHDWYLAANLGTENALGEHLISGLQPIGVPECLSGTAIPFSYNELQELENIIATHRNQIAAIVMEPLRSEDPDPAFISGVRELADEEGAPLIVDEISAGFRFLTGGAHLVIDQLTPDIAVFSKALGNGFPIAAVIGKADVMGAAQTTFISSTNWTERTGPSAALATIKKHDALNVAQKLISLGSEVQRGWTEAAMKHQLAITVGGMKPCGHFAFNYPQAEEMKAFFIQSMIEQGFLSSTQYYAMYAHTENHVSDYLKAVDLSFDRIADAVGRNKLSEQLSGKASKTGFRRLN